MRWRDVTSGRVDLSRRAVERGGWLSALPRDPGQDPPTFPRVRRECPVTRRDFDPQGGTR